jgi:uncharacterized integral membrane protein
VQLPKAYAHDTNKSTRLQLHHLVVLLLLLLLLLWLSNKATVKM